MRRLLLICLFSILAGSCATPSLLIGVNPEIYRCDPWKGEQLVRMPGWSNAWHMTSHCSIADPAKAAISMKIFYLHWVETFGDPGKRVWKNLDSILIMWGPESKEVHSGYDLSGNFLTGVRAKGIAHSKGTIWVKKDTFDLMCESSLIHELAHASIWAIKLTDGDPDHLGNRYKGWTVDHSALVQNVREELCLLDI